MTGFSTVLGSNRPTVADIASVLEGADSGAAVDLARVQSSAGLAFVVAGVFDGVTDDTTAWRNAVLAAYNAGGGAVVGRPGTSIVTGDICSLLPANGQARIEIRGASHSVYGGTELKCVTPGATIVLLRNAGITITDLRFTGDGTTYGVGSTVVAIDARGGQNGTVYDLDATVRDCQFVYLARGITQRGKNLTLVGTNIFSNCTYGMYLTTVAGATEVRGCDIGSETRFHSIGGQGNTGIAVYADPTANFQELFVRGYFDDVNLAFDGYAGPLTISDVRSTRSWGGVRINTAGRTLPGHNTNIVNITNTEWMYVSGAQVRDVVSVTSDLDIAGTIDGIRAFNFPANGISFSSASGKGTEFLIDNAWLRQPGSGGVYDCIKLGPEVGGVTIGSVSLELGASTSTGVGLRIAGPRTSTSKFLGNILSQNIRVTGFADAQRVSLAVGRDFGPRRPVRNEPAVLQVALDINIGLVVGTHTDTVLITAPLTATRNYTLSTVNAYDGASFLVKHVSTDAFTVAVIAGGTTHAALATGQWCRMVFNGPAGAWVLVDRG